LIKAVSPFSSPKPDRTRKAWTFLDANDRHLGTPRSYRFRPAIKKQIAAIDADLLLHGGGTREVECQHAPDDLDGLPFPTFVVSDPDLFNGSSREH